MNSQPQRSSEQQQATGLAPAKAQAQSVENWVQCDRCGKWRRVREDLLDDLDDASNWYCEDNPDEQHNHCNVPQEMTNDEIDRGRAMETLAHERMKRQRRPAVWQLIRDNIYTHRKPKKLYEDDIMVCQCKPASQKGISCQHEDCLNGMLNIECVNGFCPSGKECRNQRFQKRQYSKFEVRRAGLKGFGLFALEHIKKGAFIVEYVGELLDEEEYLRRKDYYHSVGQRHYYFMNIGNGEVVDACRKGNRARFINHSCEPNAETQKWMVKGELKIGFFATKDIPINTEIQFDYNFERYGDKPTKCHCAAPSCRGFIGGSSDRYAGSAVDDAVMQGVDLPPIMLTAEMKDAKLAPDLELVMDQVVGIGLGEEPANPALDDRLQALAAQQGTQWEPSPSPDDSPEQPNSAQMPPAAPPLALGRVKPPVPGTAAPLSGPLIQQPLQHLAQLQGAALPLAAAPALPPLSDAALAAAGAPPELLSVATNGLPGPLRASNGAAVLASADGGAQQNSKGTDKQYENGKDTGEDNKSGETRLSESDQSEEEQISSDSDAGPPAEDDDWLDSADRYKELPGTPPANPLTVPAAAKRKRTQRPQQPVKRKRTTESNGAQSLSSKDKGRKDSQIRRRPEQIQSTASGAHQGAGGAAGTGLKSDTDAAISNERDSAASVATGAQLPTTQGRDTQAQGAQGPAQGKKRKVVKTLSPAKPMHPGSTNNHVHERSNLKEGSASAAASPCVAPPVATAAASEASASAGNSLKRPAWPKNSAKNASIAAAPSAARKRSEVERRLEQFVGAGAHKMLRVDAVKDFVRLFNMCDISPPMQRDDDARIPVGPAMDDSVVSRRRQQSNMETDQQLTHRQRSRMADLSLLLEKILGASGHTLKKELLRCGLLSRLQFCAINNYGMGYTSSLRKICRAVQALPITTSDLHARRSAQGSFADVLRALNSHGDREVRKRSYALLDAHPQPPEERERERQEREKERQERERERERERRERLERAADRGPDRGPDRGWDRGSDDRSERAERPVPDRDIRGNGDRGHANSGGPDSMYRSGAPEGMHRNHQQHISIKGPGGGPSTGVGRESRWSAGGPAGQPPPRPGINGDTRRLDNGGTVRGALDNSTGGAATPSMHGSGAVGARGAQMPNGAYPPTGGFIPPFPIRPPPPPPPPRNSGLPPQRAPSPGSAGAPHMQRGAGPARPPMQAHGAVPPYPHETPGYASGHPSASPAYAQPPAPPLPGASPVHPHSPLYPMHSYPPANGVAHAPHPQTMHDYNALPPSGPPGDPPPPSSDTQPPLPPEPEPEPVPPPPPFYPVDIEDGIAAVKKRSQDAAAPAQCMQSMVGVPSSVTQLLNLGLYDAARLFMRRHHHHHHHGSQRRNA